MSHTINYISTHPIVALKVMICQLLLSFAVYEFQLPIIVMQIFQLMAFGSTITIGVITLYKFIKNQK